MRRKWASRPHLSRGYYVALTSYVGVAGIESNDQRGVLFVDSRLRLADVADGLSNTILLGERPPSPDMYFGWRYAGVASSSIGGFDSTLGVASRNPFDESVLLGDCPLANYKFQPSTLYDPCGALQYWSLHPDGGHFALLDGSVKFFPYAAADLLPVLATRNAGDHAPVE